MTIYLDSETYCEVPLKNGTFAYAAHCETDIVTYAFDDGPVRTWDVTASRALPDDLAYFLLEEDDELVAHNALFDRTTLRLGNLKLDIPLERWRCTMANALQHSLPGGLGELCAVLEVPEDLAKQKRGRQLMQLFCKPRPKSSELRRATRLTHPAEWAEYLEYAHHDILAMREVDKRLPKWNRSEAERALWLMDQRINERGIAIDVPFAEEIVKVVAAEQKRLKKETQERTSYDASTGEGLESTTQRDAMLRYLLAEHGVLLPDLQKDTIERRLSDPNLPAELKALLAIRLDATTTSTSKYPALLRAVSADGRLRGTKQYCGADRTGRWAGRVFQPDNLPRPKPGHKPAVIAEFIDMVKADAADIWTDDIMGFASSAVRGVIVAPPGRKLNVGDLANIEGRVAAWVTGESWKLDAFRAFDLKIGPDLYCVAYASAFKIDAGSVAKHQRQIGKVMELMLQYEGGVGAFVTGAATYGIDLEAMAAGAIDTIPADVRAEAENFLAWTLKEGRSTFGLSDQVFVVCDSFKRLWRLGHPAISGFWPRLKSAVIEAYTNPGKTFRVGPLAVRVDGSWLRIRLPSGRFLCYPKVRVRGGVISYMGRNVYTKQWGIVKTYGGKLFENIVQAIARDVLANAFAPAEAAGYEIVLHVHDELVTETPDTDAYGVEGLAQIMSTVPPWAEGLPLAAAGFETRRYYKD